MNFTANNKCLGYPVQTIIFALTVVEPLYNLNHAHHSPIYLTFYHDRNFLMIILLLLGCYIKLMAIN